MEEEKKDIELRSEEVQEIFSRVPAWIVRWGITVVFLVVGLLLVGSMFFRYPDIISSEVLITTEHPAVWVVARNSGKLQHLFVKDKQEVKEHELLGVIDNPASFEDVQQLKEELKALKPFFEEYHLPFLQLREKDYHLGEVQNSYSALYTTCRDYAHFMTQDYHRKKAEATKGEIKLYATYRKNTQRQVELEKANLDLIQKQFDRDAQLHLSKVISSVDLENAEKLLLAAQQSYEQSQISLSNVEITVEKLQQALVELDLDYNDKLMALRNLLKSNYELLTAQIATWEQQYLLVAPTNGTMTFGAVWSQNQQIVAGDKVMGIVAGDQGKIIGKVQLPTAGAGKVKVGQAVNIRLDGYPYMEYGMLPARIASISLVPNEKLYTVELDLQGLKTLYDKEIEFTGELSGIAEISTDEMSLFVRLLSPLRYFFKHRLT